MRSILKYLPIVLPIVMRFVRDRKQRRAGATTAPTRR